MPSLMICTRKGLFDAQPVAGNWALSAHHFPGEPVTQFLAVPTSGAWFAALNLGHFGLKLRKSIDQGRTWQEVTPPALPEKPKDGPWKDDPTPWTVGHIWSMASDRKGRLWAGCMPAGLFRSDDGGNHWQLMDALWFNEKRKAWFGGGNDHPGIHSILIDPNNDDHVTVAISCGGLWTTIDGGATWRNFGAGQEAGYVPPEQRGDPNTQDPHRVDQCQSAPQIWWMQHHCGLYRSSDGGENWQKLPAAQPTDFGFPVLADPRNPLRAWVVPTQADTHRYAPNGAMVVNRTDDGGQTWQSFRTGLPQKDAYHLIYRHGLTLAEDGQTMAMGSTTGGVWLSADAGASWATLPFALPLISALVWRSTAQA
jgi:hypothetical protein